MIESIVWLVITSDWPPRCVSSSLSFSIGDWRAGRTGIAGIARASAGTDTVTTGNAASGGGSWADTGRDKTAMARRTGAIGGMMMGRTVESRGGTECRRTRSYWGAKEHEKKKH